MYGLAGAPSGIAIVGRRPCSQSLNGCQPTTATLGSPLVRRVDRDGARYGRNDPTMLFTYSIQW